MGNKLLQFLLLVSIGQLLIWFQCNGQLVWKVFKDNIIFLCFLGVPISYMFITATSIGYEVFEEKLWPVRFLMFSIGAIIFSLMTYFVLGEGLNLKTCVSLLLCIAIILVQIAL
jgi:hypothetical protein